MANARQMIALLKSHVQRDDQEFLSIAMELAANEARQGHSQVATTIKQLIDQAKSRTFLNRNLSSSFRTERNSTAFY